jgi:hypothetical protein
LRKVLRFPARRAGPSELLAVFPAILPSLFIICALGASPAGHFLRLQVLNGVTARGAGVRLSDESSATGTIVIDVAGGIFLRGAVGCYELVKSLVGWRRVKLR